MTLEVIDDRRHRHQLRRMNKVYFALFALLIFSGCASDSVSPTHEVTVDGHRIVYNAHGEGSTALVFVHGAISHRHVWDEAVDAFASEHRVLSLDLPGHGDSDARDYYDASHFSDALLGVMDDADVENAILVGHSFGVSVARDVAIENPARVSGLYMMDGYVVPLGGDPEVAEALRAAFETEGWQDVAAGFIEQFMLGESTPADVANRIREMMGAGTQGQWLGVLGVATDEAIERDDVISVPTSADFLRGPAFPQEYEQYLAERFPNIEISFAPEGTGHFLMWERGEDFQQRLRELIARVDR